MKEKRKWPCGIKWFTHSWYQSQQVEHRETSKLKCFQMCYIMKYIDTLQWYYGYWEVMTNFYPHSKHTTYTTQSSVPEKRTNTSSVQSHSAFCLKCSLITIDGMITYPYMWMYTGYSMQETTSSFYYLVSQKNGVLQGFNYTQNKRDVSKVIQKTLPPPLPAHHQQQTLQRPWKTIIPKGSSCILCQGLFWFDGRVCESPNFTHPAALGGKKPYVGRVRLAHSLYLQQGTGIFEVSIQ